NKFLKLYLLLIIVTFISVSVISLMPNILWLSLKPEVNSIILGYNNFWQIGVNLDYFARHIDSPFMHLWYISILL
ncbi:MAG: acetyltransferase, partial [Bacilli bacterium]|nr:acetyltransferase [Bacilli bacterium]